MTKKSPLFPEYFYTRRPFIPNKTRLTPTTSLNHQIFQRWRRKRGPAQRRRPPGSSSSSSRSPRSASKTWTRCSWGGPGTRWSPRRRSRRRRAASASSLSRASPTWPRRRTWSPNWSSAGTSPASGRWRSRGPRWRSRRRRRSYRRSRSSSRLLISWRRFVL